MLLPGRHVGENLRCAWGGAPAGHKASARAAPPVHGARSMPLPASSSRVMSSRNTTLTSSDLERSRMPVWGPVGGGETPTEWAGEELLPSGWEVLLGDIPPSGEGVPLGRL